MKKLFLFITSIIVLYAANAQNKSPYTIFNSKGKKVNYQKMLQFLKDKDLVFFGEQHNNAIAHWLQLTVTKALKESRDLVLGAEMIETDNQQALNDYLSGKLSASGLDSNARLWKNYSTDYAPLVNFAKENNLIFVACNVPRRYASLVAKGGFEKLDTLPQADKNWIAPLPIEYEATLPGYTKMIEMMGGHGGPNLPKAQALKDATMAFNILKYYKPGSLFIHYNGAFHSDYYEGINWYIKRKKPEMKIATISTVTQKNIYKLEKEHLGKADFIICVDQEMTNTY